MAEGTWYSPGTLASWLGEDSSTFHSTPSPEIGEEAPEILILACCSPSGPAFPSVNNHWVPPALGPVKTVRQGMLISPPMPLHHLASASPCSSPSP